MRGDDRLDVDNCGRPSPRPSSRAAEARGEGEKDQMTAETARQFEALERQALKLMAVFTAAGCEAVAPAIIQPADVFLDVIGEDLRARTYVFTDPEGRELCLRPDLTVPACRIYLARHPHADAAARYCYNGPAFRFQPHGADAAHPNEFRQAGLELIGDSDPEQAETEVMRLVLAAMHGAGLADYHVRLGDLALFHALLDELDMPHRARQRLRAQFWRPDAFRAALKRLTSSPAGSLTGLPADLVATLEPGNLAASEARVAKYCDEHGLAVLGSRALAEVTEGLLAAAEDARSEPIAPATAALIERYLAIRGPAPAAAHDLDHLAAGRGQGFKGAVGAFHRRLELMENAGIATAALDFAAEFGRNLEYYTGFVFDVTSPKLGPATPIAGGGRYDHLLEGVGAPRRVAAVGSAIHTERLLAVVSGSAA